MGTSFWTTAATVTPGGGGTGFWVLVEHPTHMVSARTVTLINIGSRNSAFLIVSLLPSQRREAPSGRSGCRRFGLNRPRWKRPVRQRLLSPVLGPPRNRRVARGSLRSSAGILPDPNREFYAQRFRAQPSQGTGEFLLLKQASCFVVSLHLRLTPSAWPEVLVQIFRLSFSSLHAVYRSPAAAQCCCADICSDQRQEITR